MGTHIYPCLYHGPILYYAMISREKRVIIEQYDHYMKQTYRNRCRIAGANGIINLTIPVKKIHGEKVSMKDAQIDYDKPWQKEHWRGIRDSYRAAPYFEFIQDEFLSLYTRRYQFLLDLNMEALQITLDLLQIHTELSLSSCFTPIAHSADPREGIHPKRIPGAIYPGFSPVRYPQVFEDRMGFIPNLSILDLLFNEGSRSSEILRKSFS